jgi:adenosylcobinamide kinase / adenosylcobinamide-phosphate guanylyltransferase
MNRVVLITGGARSGKSRYALTRTASATKRAFIATAECTDDEMRLRIDRHREERGSAFLTLEEPLDLASALGRIPTDTEVTVVDCLTVWLGNLMHYRSNDTDDYVEVRAFLEAVETPPCRLIIVSNEVGMGLVPETAMGRRFRDLAGQVNQAVAAVADEVVFMVSGVPVITKDKRKSE